ncbi:MAG TPA: hypothetical protein VLM38_21315 [Blastocatellia bacterium]|nr:hypothetical protein [Blastocatellia bacterium]
MSTNSGLTPSIQIPLGFDEEFDSMEHLSEVESFVLLFFPVRNDEPIASRPIFIVVFFRIFFLPHFRLSTTTPTLAKEISMHRQVRLFLLTLIVSSVIVPALVEAAPQFHFAISEVLLNQLATDNSISRTMRIGMNARSAVHTLSSDCEIHVGGTVQDMTLGQPAGMVVEPPNLCKIKPEGTTGNPSGTQVRNVIWPISSSCSTGGSTLEGLEGDEGDDGRAGAERRRY